MVETAGSLTGLRISDRKQNEAPLKRKIVAPFHMQESSPLILHTYLSNDRYWGGLPLPSLKADFSLPVELPAEALTGPPVELQASLDRLSGLIVSPDDIDALISTLEARSGGTRVQSISELRQGILQLRGELEQESAKKRDLKKSRDIAWETCTTLDNKAAEVKVATLAQDIVVRVAVVAVVPERPVSPRRVMNIGIALVLGLIVGVFGAFGVEYFKKTAKKPEEEKNEE